MQGTLHLVWIVWSQDAPMSARRKVFTVSDTLLPLNTGKINYLQVNNDLIVM